MPICVLAAANCVRAASRVVNHGGVKCAAAGIVMIFTLLIVSARDGPTKQMDYFWLCLAALEASQPQK